MKRIACLLLALLLLMLCVGCGAKENLTGTWTMTLLGENLYTFAFSSKGTVQLKVGKNSAGTYYYSAEKGTLTLFDEDAAVRTYTYRFEDGFLILNENGTELRLEKR